MSSSSRFISSHARRISLIYAVFAIGWIAFSDAILAMLIDKPAHLAGLQTAKGAAFVLITAALLYTLIRRAPWWQQEKAALEARYDYLSKYANDIILLADEYGNIIEANDRALEAYGYSREELLSINGKQLRAESSRGEFSTALDKINNQSSSVYETLHQRKDGSVFPVEVSSRMVELDGRRYSHIVIRDITERKLAQARIQRMTMLYKALSETNQAIVRMEQECDLFPLVCRNAVQYGGMKMAWIGQLDSASKRLVPTASYGSGQEYLNRLNVSADIDLPEGRGPTGTAFRENRIVIIDDYSTAPMTAPWRPLVAQYGFKSAATFPITRGGVPFAVLTVYDENVDAFDEAVVSLLAEMAMDISFALDNFDHEAQRQALTLNLASMQQRLAHIVDISPAIIYTLVAKPGSDGKFTIDFISDNVQRLTGYPTENWLNTPSFWFDHVHPDDQPSALEAQEQLMVQGSAHHRYRFRHASGAYLWIDDQLILNRDSDGHPQEIVGTWLDITELEHAEAARRSGDQRFRAFFERSMVGMATTSPDKGWLDVNPALCEMLGYSSEELKHTAWAELTHPDDLPANIALFERMMAGEIEEYALDKRFIRKDGSIVYTHIAARSLRKPDGSLDYIVVLLEDITDRKLAEEQLKLTSRVFESSQEGIFITDTENNILSANRAFTEITGYSETEAVGRNPRILSSKRHDADFYQAMWQSVLTDGHWQGEIWNCRKNGEIFPEWLSISVVRDAANNITHHIGILTDISEYKAAEEKIHYLAHYDPLTNLPNRTLLQDRVMVALSAAQREHLHVALMFLDLDRFKTINDSLGHQVGDLLLQEVAIRLGTLLREGDTVSRLGGDEFILVLPDTDDRGAAHVAEKILDLISQPFDIQNYELNLTISLGIALFPENGATFNDLSRCADSALYRAKNTGRNNFQFFTDEMHAKALEVLRVESDLRRAVERGEMRLHYQPQVETTTGRIVGAEALVRWQHPEWGLTAPGVFIQVAEDTGLIAEIGDWVMRHAIEQNRAWQQAGLPIVPVAVNVSVAQFRQKNIADKVDALLQETGLGAQFLELELTESIAMEDSIHTIATVDKLHQLGVELSIDDFGTGYSSLSYLKRFRVQKIKIDQSFVRDLVHDVDDEAIVVAIISMAKSLGFRTIAEGVETAEQFAFLRASKCDQVQGYLHSRPVPPDEFAGLLSAGELHPASQNLLI